MGAPRDEATLRPAARLRSCRAAVRARWRRRRRQALGRGAPADALDRGTRPHRRGDRRRAAGLEALQSADPQWPCSLGVAHYHAGDVREGRSRCSADRRQAARGLDRAPRGRAGARPLATTSPGRIAEAMPWLEATREWARHEPGARSRSSALPYIQTRQPDKAREVAGARLRAWRPTAPPAHLLAAQMMIRAASRRRWRKRSSKKALAKDPRPPARPLPARPARPLPRATSTRRSRHPEGDRAEPVRHVASSQLGDVYVRQQKWDEAVAALQRSIWVNPFYSAPYILLGRAYMKTGAARRPPRRMLRRAIEYDPNNKRPTTCSASCCSRLGRSRGGAQGAGARRAQLQDGRRRCAPGSPPACVRRGVAARRGRRRRLARARSSTSRAEAGLARAVGLRRHRSQAVHHRDERRGRRLGRRTTTTAGSTRSCCSGTQPRGGHAARNARGRPARRPPTASIATTATAPSATSPTRQACERTGWSSCGLRRRLRQRRLARPLRHGLRAERPLPQPSRARFEDVTAAAGLADDAAPAGARAAAFVDYDRDGRLDLFVANYLVARPRRRRREPGQGANCLWKGIPVNCGPKGLPTDTNLLYHNEGGRPLLATSRRRRASRA